ILAGDVYAEPPHVGRGGWTWYTGSAVWMYRAGLEWILGFRLRGTRLVVDPCIPRAWQGFNISFRYHSARYDIAVENPQGVTRGVSSVEVDGVPYDGQASIPLADDQKKHRIRIVLGSFASQISPKCRSPCSIASHVSGGQGATRRRAAKLKPTNQSHSLKRSSSPSAHARATA